MNSKNRKEIWRVRPCAQAVAIAAGLMAAFPAVAEDAAAPVKVEKIEVTGSSIKRIVGETALPVQTIKREDIVRSGSTTAAEILTKISASAAALTDGASFSDIAGQRGFNGANLRGAGVSSTLVLLNGRRMANFASPGGNSGVDLNAIPSAAIERVEVLKDGASAIYGTDAIGGVINFITRKDYQGADLYGYVSDTQDGGAGKKIVTASGGYGALDENRFNVFGVLDYQKTDGLKAVDRDWNKGAFQPDINLDVASSNTSPANFRRLGSNGRPTGSRRNLSAPDCNPPATLYDPDSFVGPRACYYDYMHDTELFPESSRLSLLGRAQFAVNDDFTLFAEALHGVTETTYRISPLTITNLDYPVLGKYYPTIAGYNDTAATRTALRMNWRLSPAGLRTNEVKSVADRFVFGGKGTVAGWDIDSAVNYATNKVTDAYVDGYVKTTDFNNAFATGNINPFTANPDQTTIDLIRSTKIRDNARDSKGTTTTVDLKGSRPVFELPGGDAALALGTEWRRETLRFTPSELLTSGEIRGDGSTPGFSGSRRVGALFSELNLPLTKTIEAQLAVRYDKYDDDDNIDENNPTAPREKVDVGGTTNPKVAIRWTPVKSVLVRGSYNTGFRAPSLSDIHAPSFLGQTSGIYNDAIYEAKVGKCSVKDNPDYCGIQPDKLKGGGSTLKPEKSKQFSFGAVFEPNRNFSTSLDYFSIEKTDVIASPEGVYFDNPEFYSAYITRDNSNILPGMTVGPITEIDSRLRNLGGFRTSGLDVGVDVRFGDAQTGRFGTSLSGTYTMNYKVKEGPGMAYENNVGRYKNDQVIQRWRHSLTFTYDKGPWAHTLVQTFSSHYQDQNPNPDGSVRYVPSYSLWDIATAYSGVKNLKIRAGVKNLLDTAPPRSNQVFSFLAGYDPNYADTRGRTYYASVGYSFR